MINLLTVNCLIISVTLEYITVISVVFVVCHLVTSAVAPVLSVVIVVSVVFKNLRRCRKKIASLLSSKIHQVRINHEIRISHFSVNPVTSVIVMRSPFEQDILTFSNVIFFA